MPNTIKAEVNFHFSGEKKHLSTLIELDSFTAQNTTLSNKVILIEIANKNAIDKSSTLYHSIQFQNIIFSQPTGCAVQFCKDSKFDFLSYKLLNEEHQTCEEVIAIVRSNMNIESLDEVQGLEQTLLDLCDIFKKK